MFNLSAAMGAVSFRLNAPNHFLDVRGQRAGFVLLAAFLLTFIFIRTSARMNRSQRFSWWPGSVRTGSGVHLHHLVWGIVLMMVAGFVNFAWDPGSPLNEILSALFGVGVGLTLDEFALWIYLRDVYWAEEGRSSFDAVVIATVFAALILVGVAPFDVSGSGTTIGSLSIVLVLDVLLSLIVIYKGKPLVGVIGIFVPLVSLVGAIRLAAPDSRWARRRYGAGPRSQVGAGSAAQLRAGAPGTRPGSAIVPARGARPGSAIVPAPPSAKLQRAQERWARIEERRRRIADLVAGAPHLPSGSETHHGQL
ncbi:MAG TPA: hypothetical protein VFN65_12135 [Solirubrobacteraceae bacterium]|nr:hypothetical protein [Solirubrobacteraceae bacterium]